MYMLDYFVDYSKAGKKICKFFVLSLFFQVNKVPNLY